MLEPFNSGASLIGEIDSTLSLTPALWWLGHAGFVVRFATMTFYVDPCLSVIETRHRVARAPLTGAEVAHADLVLCTSLTPDHFDAASLQPMLALSRRAKVVIPKSGAAEAEKRGVPLHRLTTTDADLRVEYFKMGQYGRVYAVPSAAPNLAWTPDGGYPYLGYLIRFGHWTIYHAGHTVLYPGLADKLRPYSVNIAILPISGSTLRVNEAAQLAADIGAQWIVPMHYGTFSDEDPGAESRFIQHMLGHRPEQRFKIFQIGEKWIVPE